MCKNVCVENHSGACAAAQIGFHDGDQVDGFQPAVVSMHALKTALALAWRHQLAIMTVIRSMGFKQML